MLKKLQDLNEKEFNVLKDGGILKNIYSDAPENFRDIKGKKPLPLEKSDFSILKKMAIEHLNDIEKGEDREDDEHYFYETVMNTVFGPEVWEFINKKH